ncbi:hypothetical protein M3J09_009083 [Ascochyta lentis]
MDRILCELGLQWEDTIPEGAENVDRVPLTQQEAREAEALDDAWERKSGYEDACRHAARGVLVHGYLSGLVASIAPLPYSYAPYMAALNRPITHDPPTAVELNEASLDADKIRVAVEDAFSLYYQQRQLASSGGLTATGAAYFAQPDSTPVQSACCRNTEWKLVPTSTVSAQYPTVEFVDDYVPICVANSKSFSTEKLKDNNGKRSHIVRLKVDSVILRFIISTGP